MKSKRSEIICIILAVILLFIGMCSQMGRVDSLVASFQSAHEADVADTITDIKSNSLYIGNCTSKLITGLRDTFRNLRRKGEERVNRNHTEIFVSSGILKLFLSMAFAGYVICVQIPDNKATILTYIHNQDGEK